MRRAAWYVVLGLLSSLVALLSFLFKEHPDSKPKPIAKGVHSNKNKHQRHVTNCDFLRSRSRWTRLKR